MYATAQDMIERFGERELVNLTDREGALDTVDTTVLERAIGDATATVDGWLAGSYEVPLDPAPTVIVKITCMLARYELYDDAPTGKVAKDKEDALAFLRAVARGQVSLGMPAAGAGSAAQDGAVVESPGRVFGRDRGGFL